MQLNIYPQFIEIEKILDYKKIIDLKEYLDFNIDSRITCNDMANKLDIEYSDAKRIIRILCKNGITEMNFMVNCSSIYDTNLKEYYECLEDIPDEICYDCDKKCELLRNVFIVYKVLSGDIYEE